MRFIYQTCLVIKDLAMFTNDSTTINLEQKEVLGI